VNPLDADLGLRFLPPRSTCAVCGREVDPDGAAQVADLDEPHVESAVEGLQMLVDVTPGERLVICRECQAK
jgi:hypothetical protein